MPIHDIFSIFLIILGTLFVVISAIGMIRLPDFYLRMSAITKAATLGLALLLIGLSIHFNNLELSIKSFIIITLVFLTSPVGAHAIARAAYKQGTSFWEGAIVDELQAMADRKKQLEKQLKKSPDDIEIISELAELYKKLPTAQGGSLKKAKMMEEKLRNVIRGTI
ncbi:MAG: monovalent cation/H(+) antiporter subunit G [Prolixibacteraceae bacterium]|nr:monovalent cation/H(+) antiporter subunit G [Prolixibacteraceae bacterium]MBN2648923.1 monovalent cation/H(+) antiporter subunit G [Prolixibacteraceae bacterium]